MKNIYFTLLMTCLIGSQFLSTTIWAFPWITYPEHESTIYFDEGSTTNITVTWNNSYQCYDPQNVHAAYSVTKHLSDGTTENIVFEIVGIEDDNFDYHSGSFSVDLAEGNYSASVLLLYICGEYPYNAQNSHDFTVIRNSSDITFANNFTGGTVNVDNEIKQSPFSSNYLTGTTVNISAIENQSFSEGGQQYNMIWNNYKPEAQSKWERRKPGLVEFKTWNKSYPLQVSLDDHNSTYVANLRKQCNISLSNQFSGTSMGGQMYINKDDGQAGWFSVPKAETIVEQNPIVFMAGDYYDENNIRYIFDKWNDNITSKSRTIYPSSHETYTAIYKGYPIFDMRNLVISGVREGKTYYIKLDWNEHPNSYVTQYHIYRYTKYESETTDPVHVATRSRGTTTFTDYAFTYAPTTGEYQVYYDVKAYFSLDGTVSPNNFTMVRGNDDRIEKSGNETEEELIKEYAVICSK